MELITFMMCSCDSVTIFSMKNFWGLAFQILYLASKGAQMPISLCRLVWPNAEQFSGKLNLEIRPHVLTGEVLMVSWEVAQMDFVEECGCAVFVLLVERWCQIWDANVLSAWRCVLHKTTAVVVVVQAHFQQLRYFFFRLHTTTLVVLGSWPQRSSLLLYWCNVWSGDKTLWILVESLFKSNCLPCFWPWSSLLVSHRNYKQKRAKETYYNHHKYSQLHIALYFEIKSSCGCHQCWFSLFIPEE